MALSRVAVRDSDRLADMSVSDFLGLPLDQRVRFVLENQLLFYDEAGRLLSTADGLKLLRGVRDLAPLPAR